MSAPLAVDSVTDVPRKIARRTRGSSHGGITRLMSPGDLGELLKPFVFLDLFDLKRATFSGFGLHPHSGIATITYLFEGSVFYEDTNGENGLLREGGVEWFSAGGGAWHGGGPGDSERARGFQLWVALPAGKELGAPQSLYQAGNAMVSDGPVTAVIGQYGKTVSPWPAPSPMNYLAVRLLRGERWTYEPPAGHTVAWAAVNIGQLRATEPIDAGELVVFEEGSNAVTFEALDATDFVVGSAVPHGHDLILGQYSVHTNSEALAAAERRIAEIGSDLRAQGRR